MKQLEVYPDWKVSAKVEQAREFVARLNSAFPARWSEVENDYPGAREFRVDDSNGLVPSRLILMEHNDRLSVTNIVAQRPEHGRITIQEYNTILSDFCEVAEAIASSMGLTVEKKTSQTHIRRWLSPAAEEKLLGFSRAANKSTGSAHPMDRDRWFAFIMQAHLDQSDLNEGMLQRFLIEDEEWGEDQAWDLACEYERGRDLLTAYDGRRTSGPTA